MKHHPSDGGLRILFAGSPAIALPSLAMIGEAAKSGLWSLAGILTNPDKRK
jgi:methionyl-tRNA formyltransferase